MKCGQNVIKCKWVWVYKIKPDVEGRPDRFKARLVARGFSQRFGVDFDETFSPVPVVRYSTLRLLFATAVERDMDIEYVDVSTAFLNGELSEKIYMEKPGYRDG